MVEIRVVGTGRMKSLVMAFAVSAFRCNHRPPMLVKLPRSLRLPMCANLHYTGNPFFQQFIE